MAVAAARTRAQRMTHRYCAASATGPATTRPGVGSGGDGTSRLRKIRRSRGGSRPACLQKRRLGSTGGPPRRAAPAVAAGGGDSRRGAPRRRRRAGRAPAQCARIAPLASRRVRATTRRECGESPLAGGALGGGIAVADTQVPAEAERLPKDQRPSARCCLG